MPTASFEKAPHSRALPGLEVLASARAVLQALDFKNTIIIMSNIGLRAIGLEVYPLEPGKAYIHVCTSCGVAI
jgi:hypothetical protein